jgi:hypothetical protein
VMLHATGAPGADRHALRPPAHRRPQDEQVAEKLRHNPSCAEEVQRSAAAVRTCLAVLVTPPQLTLTLACAGCCSCYTTGQSPWS